MVQSSGRCPNGCASEEPKKTKTQEIVDRLAEALRSISSYAKRPANAGDGPPFATRTAELGAIADAALAADDAEQQRKDA